MAHSTKIATCCHCGTRALLQMQAGQHTLSCGACGAPLNRLKPLPVAAPVSKPAVTHQPVMSSQRKYAQPLRPKPVKRRKKRKSLLRQFAEEAFDMVEDIFD